MFQSGLATNEHEKNTNKKRSRIFVQLVHMSEILLKDEVYEIVGALMDVYNTLGVGFLEPVYQDAVAIEMRRRAIAFEKERKLEVRYKDVILERTYVPDFICFGQIILELKVVPRLTSVEVAQILNYLRVTGMKVGVLANFGSPTGLEWKRYVL